MLPQYFLDRYKLKQEHVPYKAFNVRITVPHLLYSVDTKVETERRTILPQFVAIYIDSSLECAEASNQEMLRKAYIDLTAPDKTPSGLINKYGKIPYAFPTAISLIPNNYIATALITYKKQESPRVVVELERLIYLNVVDLRAQIKKQRDATIARVKANYKDIKYAERNTFGN